MNIDPLYQVRGPNATVLLYNDPDEAENLADKLNQAMWQDTPPELLDQLPTHYVHTIRTEEGRAT